MRRCRPRRVRGEHGRLLELDVVGRSGGDRGQDDDHGEGEDHDAGDPCDLVEAIREVGKGRTYLPPAIAQNIAFAGPSLAQNPLSKLTSREIEILRLLSAGKSLSEIAWLVHSSYKTIANTSSIMRQKLGVRTSAELVRLAIENSLT